jgi:hypothetical protein
VRLTPSARLRRASSRRSRLGDWYERDGSRDKHGDDEGWALLTLVNGRQFATKRIAATPTAVTPTRERQRRRAGAHWKNVAAAGSGL